MRKLSFRAFNKKIGPAAWNGKKGGRKRSKADELSEILRKKKIVFLCTQSLFILVLALDAGF